ncbi:MAG: sodium:proton antiporter [Nitrospirae bacterium GWC2_56_14]|nr:MAG: sodium:proton antiporter [Nitrospirae bacterium GWC2_56_14]
MDFNLLFLIIGALLIVMALTESMLKRLPLTTSLLYLGAGVLLGPFAAGMIQADPVALSPVLERVTEVAVIVSLFTAGLKLRLPFSDPLWKLPVRLAVLSMMITILLVTLTGIAWLDLPLGAAVLLGAILAPTDPVLASDVQVEEPWDVERLRFSLTGEAGLNDGMAFPFVMLGLGLLGLHEIGELGWRWLAVDVLWAIGGGIGIGGLLGTAVGHFVIYLRRKHKEATGTDDFLALGLIALSYGVALLCHTYGFLAVFAAGAAIRRIERRQSEETAEAREASEGELPEEAAHDPIKAPAHMAKEVLAFNVQVERIGEVGIVVLVGGMLGPAYLAASALWFIPLLLLVIRPVSVWLGLLSTPVTTPQKTLMGWFGIRGVGSIYYLMYGINHELSPELSHRLTALTLLVVAVSVVLHGVSVTPLMNRYSAKQGG